MSQQHHLEAEKSMASKGTIRLKSMLFKEQESKAV